MDQRTQEKRYILLDSKGTVLARGTQENASNAPVVQVRVEPGKVTAVLEHEDIQLVAFSEGVPNVLGRIIRRDGDLLTMEKIKLLGVEVRQNLRMPVKFDSFIYPLTGAWKGRRTVRANDLSCGGAAFFCEENLAVGERLEIVIPVTAQPLILRCQVLRQKVTGSEVPLYATKFVDLCDDEERMVRSAVFSIQVESRAQADLRKVKMEELE